MVQPEAYLREVEPFSRLDPQTMAAIAPKVIGFEPAQWLVRQGAAPDGGLLVVVAGKASIVSESDGAERVVGTCGPGEFAGVTGVLTGEPHPVGVRADTAVECLEVPREALAQCLETPGFAAYFSRTLAARLRRAYSEFALDRSYRSAGLDAHPLRRKVSDLMRPLVVTCAPDTPIADVAVLMRAQGVSSVVVARDKRPVGIVTATDMVHKVMAPGGDQRRPVELVMSTPVETIPGEAFYYEALLRLVRRNIKHLPVVDASGGLIGLLTLGYLARVRGEGALSVVDQIERESTAAGLTQVAARIDDVLRALLRDGAQPAQILPVMTELNDRLTRRLISLAMERLGEPPCDWCWLQLGSAGREEQFTRTDQDHALIYTGSPERADRYFAALADAVVDGLAQCGFARCPGDVMATNPVWRRSYENWRFQVISMVNRPAPEQIRTATIFLDFRPIAGNRALAASLWEQVWSAVESLPLFLYHLVRDDLAHSVPIGPFKTVLTPLWGEHKGQINLKADACVHVVDLLRALALKYKVAHTSTLGRLRGLVQAGAVSRDEADWLEIAYQTLMRLRMADAVHRLDAGESPSHYVQLSSLSEPQRAALRDALVAVARLQESVGSALAPGGAR